MNAEDGTGEFNKFLDFLGDKIPLKDWQGYRGDLDLKGFFIFYFYFYFFCFISTQFKTQNFSTKIFLNQNRGLNWEILDLSSLERIRNYVSRFDNVTIHG